VKRISSFAVLAVGIIIGVLGGAALTTAYSEQAKIDYNQAVARAGETTITRGRLAEYAISSMGDKLLATELHEIAIAEEAARLQGVTVSAEELQQRVKDSFDFAESAMVRERLKAVPPQLFAERLHAVMLVEKMIGVKVTDVDAKTFYYDPKHSYLFIQPALVKATWIVTDTEENAAAALNRLKDGEDPKVVAADCSSDDTVRERKGDLGWFSRGSLNPTLAEAVFDAHNNKGLAKNEFTNYVPIKTDQIVKDDKGIERTVQATQYFILAVNDVVAAKTLTYQEAMPAATFYARTYKYAMQAPKWFANQEKMITWKVAKDLFDPISELQVVPPSAQPKALRTTPDGTDN